MGGITIDNPLSLVIVYTLALGAIYKGSYRGLTKHIQRLQPDIEEKENDFDEKKELNKEEGVGKEMTTSEVESQPSKEEEKPKSRWAKWRDGLAAAGMAALMWGFGILIGVGLPKIATPRILDMVWMFMVGFQVYVIYNELIANVLPDPRCTNITWSSWRSITFTETKVVPSGPVPKTTTRCIASGLLTLATLGGVYSGTEWIVAFPIAALVYTAVSSIITPDHSIRSTLKWMAKCQAAIVALAGIIVGGIWTYNSHYPKGESNIASKNTDAKASREVMTLMMMFQQAVPLVIAGYLVGVALRFDYTRALRSNLITAPTVSHSTKFAKLPFFPKRFAKAAFSTLSVVILNYGFSQLHPSSKFRDTGVILYMLCVPATIVAVRMMLIAVSEGVWEEFMVYTELGSKALKEQQSDQKDIERTERDMLSVSEKDLLQ